MDRILAIAAPLAAQKGLRLDVEIDPGLRGRWSGDARKFERMLSTLVGNAVKFTRQGGVRLAVFSAGEAVGQVQVVFEVRDSGPGMDPGQVSRLFTPFYQGDSSPSRSHGGTGLGLAIVNGLAEQMGAALRLRVHRASDRPFG